MFKTISIVNFKGYREAEIDLSSGVNVFTGVSDSGKTSILQDLDWLFNNRPSGEPFRNWYCDPSDTIATEVTTSEGTNIALSREKGKNTYILTTKQGKSISFQAIGTSVPSEIAEALNIAPYNVQKQHQTYFLLQDTPGEVARALNELTGLSIIDSAFKKVSSKIRETGSKIEGLKSERDRGKEQLKQYDNLDSIRILIEDIERDTVELSKIEADRVKITNSITELNKIKERLAEQQSYIKVGDEIDPIFVLINEHNQIGSWEVRIQELLRAISSIKEDLEQDAAWLEMEPPYVEISDLLKEYDIVSRKKDSLSSLLFLLKRNEEGKRAATSILQKEINGYIALLNEAKICPTCGTPTSKQMLEEIKTRL